jgi:hypothetical protein
MMFWFFGDDVPPKRHSQTPDAERTLERGAKVIRRPGNTKPFLCHPSTALECQPSAWPSLGKGMPVDFFSTYTRINREKLFNFPLPNYVNPLLTKTLQDYGKSIKESR